MLQRRAGTSYSHTSLLLVRSHQAARYAATRVRVGPAFRPTCRWPRPSPSTHPPRGRTSRVSPASPGTSRLPLPRGGQANGLGSRFPRPRDTRLAVHMNEVGFLGSATQLVKSETFTPRPAGISSRFGFDFRLGSLWSLDSLCCQPRPTL
jgi:hypothetical protein